MFITAPREYLLFKAVETNPLASSQRQQQGAGLFWFTVFLLRLLSEHVRTSQYICFNLQGNSSYSALWTGYSLLCCWTLITEWGRGVSWFNCSFHFVPEPCYNSLHLRVVLNTSPLPFVATASHPHPPPPAYYFDFSRQFSILRENPKGRLELVPKTPAVELR
jgi:hypothetical protein